jgi:hypothetical protein
MGEGGHWPNSTPCCTHTHTHTRTQAHRACAWRASSAAAALLTRWAAVLFAGGAKGGVAALDVGSCRELASCAAGGPSPVTSLALTPQLLLAGDLDGAVTAYRPHPSLLQGSDHAWSAVAAALDRAAPAAPQANK